MILYIDIFMAQVGIMKSCETLPAAFSFNNYHCSTFTDVFPN